MPVRILPAPTFVTAPAAAGTIHPRISNRWAVAALVVFVTAAGLRIAAARGELWLDEVWSIDLVATEVQSPADVVFHLKHDNNHMLNSWVAYAAGPTSEAWRYRAPAVVAGVASVLLAGWAQHKRGWPTALAALTLVGLSYLMVHYSSEARGYAYLTFCMLLAYGALVRADESGSPGWELLVAASCVLGFLAHPLFLTMFIAIQVWTWLPDRKPGAGGDAHRLAVKGLCRTLLPGLFFAWLYWVNLRGMQIGGGDPQPYFGVVGQTLSLTCGGAFKGPFRFFAALVTIALSVLAVRHVFKKSRRRAAFYATVIVVAPILLLIAMPRSDIYPRYFLGSVLFLYLLWSEWCGAVFERSWRGRWLYVAVLVAMAIANATHIARLIVERRSHYREAIQLVERETTGPQVNLALDHGFRHALMLNYWSTKMKLDKPLAYDPRNPAAIEMAEWLFTHSLDPNYVPPTALRINGLHDFELVRQFPFAGLSGWQLNVYRRMVERTE